MLTGWGTPGAAAATPGAAEGAAGIPAATPPGTLTPHHHPGASGSWPSQTTSGTSASTGGTKRSGGENQGGSGGSWKYGGEM